MMRQVLLNKPCFSVIALLLQGDVNYDETSLSEQAMFQCAGCGLKIEHYAEVRYFDLLNISR